MFRPTILVLASLSLFALGCSSKPTTSEMQWVARDAWSSKCAEKAMVETWEASNQRWKIKDQVLLVDVSATFKLTDDCGLKKAYSSETFKKEGLALSKCVDQEKKGWSQPGLEGKRCWTGPRLLK